MSRSEELFDRLQAALFEGFEEAARVLDEFPEAVRAQDSVGETVLHWFAVENRLEIVRWLHERGADVNQVTPDSRLSPLRSAAILGRVKMCELLLDCGADLRQPSVFDQSPLGAAVMGDQVKVVELMLSRLPADEDPNLHFDWIEADSVLEDGLWCGQWMRQRGLVGSSDFDADVAWTHEPPGALFSSREPSGDRWWRFRRIGDEVRIQRDGHPEMKDVLTEVCVEAGHILHCHIERAAVRESGGSRLSISCPEERRSGEEPSFVTLLDRIFAGCPAWKGAWPFA